LDTKKQLYIETYGCQMNFADSEIVASILSDNYAICNDIQQADVILINTCSIRENAEQKVLKRLVELNALYRKHSSIKIGLIGCMAARFEKELIKKSLVDIVAGPDAYRSLALLLEDSYQQATNTILSTIETYDDILPLRFDSNGISAFISIMRGCNNFCSYCVVPYTRGRERSRNPKTIIEEVKKLLDKGFKEVTLLGQNVNSYEWDEHIDFPDLMDQVASVDKSLRIRFATSHPKDLSDKLLQVMAAHPNICKSIHLPAQSGSNAILKRMNRKYTREWYLQRIDAIRHYMPEAGISTDIIAGFCGETEQDHQDTLSLMQMVAYDFAFMFKYSERSGTHASKTLTDDVPDHIKTRRLEEIITLQQQLSHNSNLSDLGKSFEVLIEGTSKRSPDFYFGRNSQNKVIVFPKLHYNIGDYVNVKVESCTTATLLGSIQA
jgi:tRNA-2-methylthio-N6-dimethylallyladenosine synthase